MESETVPATRIQLHRAERIGEIEEVGGANNRVIIHRVYLTKMASDPTNGLAIGDGMHQYLLTIALGALSTNPFSHAGSSHVMRLLRRHVGREQNAVKVSGPASF